MKYKVTVLTAKVQLEHKFRKTDILIEEGGKRNNLKVLAKKYSRFCEEKVTDAKRNRKKAEARRQV
jgi:hypothetical protein